MDLPAELMEKPSKPSAWEEPGSPLLGSEQQEDPPMQQWGEGLQTRQRPVGSERASGLSQRHRDRFTD